MVIFRALFLRGVLEDLDRQARESEKSAERERRSGGERAIAGGEEKELEVREPSDEEGGSAAEVD